MKTEAFQHQLESVLADFQSFRSKSQHSDLSDIPKDERQSLVTRMIAAVHRISGTESTYSKEIDRILAQLPYIHKHTSSIAGEQIVGRERRERVSYHNWSGDA